jgi:outer membrane biosynthesis protein TonB
MTVCFLPPRALSLRLLSRAHSTPVLLSSLRVKHDQKAGHRTSPSYSNVEPIYLRLGQIQNYATDMPTSRPGRPKAHTGRATASKRKPAASKSATPKSTAAKKGAKTKRKTKTKAKPKPKPKPKPKRKTRVLTEQQKRNKKEKAAALKQRNLRITALLTPPSATPPKQLPRTAYMVINAENQVKGTSTTDIARASAAKYKALTPEEREVGLII